MIEARRLLPLLLVGDFELAELGEGMDGTFHCQAGCSENIENRDFVNRSGCDGEGRAVSFGARLA